MLLTDERGETVFFLKDLELEPNLCKKRRHPDAGSREHLVGAAGIRMGIKDGACDTSNPASCRWSLSCLSRHV
jgi:hypothetical protein